MVAVLGLERKVALRTFTHLLSHLNRDRGECDMSLNSPSDAAPVFSTAVGFVLTSKFKY